MMEYYEEKHRESCRVKKYIVDDGTEFIIDEEHPLSSVVQAWEYAGALAYNRDVLIEKRDGDEVVKIITVPQVPQKEPRDGQVTVPKEHRKKFGA